MTRVPFRLFYAEKASIVLLVAAWATAPATAGSPESPRGATAPRVVSAPVTPVAADVDLRDVPVLPEWAGGLPLSRTKPRHSLGKGLVPLGEAPAGFVPGPDPLLERAGSGVLGKSGPPSASGPLAAGAVNVAGIAFAGTNPPDTVGATGPDHYIQMVNSLEGSVFGSAYAVYDHDGALLAGPSALEELWPSGTCRTNGRGDPIVLHDQLAERWVMTQVANPFPCIASPLPCTVCVAVSKTEDPVTGGWYLYDFQVDTFPDYPKYGVALDAYLLGTNSVSFFPAFVQEGGIHALDRRRMLEGEPAAIQSFAAPFLPNGFNIQSVLPADLDGHRPAPPRGPSYFLRYRDTEIADGVVDLSKDELEIWELEVSWAHPERSILAGPTRVPIAELTPAPSNVSQPGGGPLQTFAAPLMWRVSYRNFATHETLLGSFTVDATGGGQAGIRWFELRRQGRGPWAVHQEGTFAPDAAHRWMGSVAMDRDGNIALGYSVSSPELGIHPSIRVTGRRAGDPPGTLSTAEIPLAAGDGASQTGLWGDYSSMTVDPRDDCTFWYTNEYIESDEVGWSTRIGTFRFPGCGPAAEGAGE